MAANEDEDELYAQVRPWKRKRNKKKNTEALVTEGISSDSWSLFFYDFKKQKLTSVLLSLFFSLSFSTYRFFVFDF